MMRTKNRYVQLKAISKHLLRTGSYLYYAIIVSSSTELADT